MTDRPIGVDLFAGAGGMSLGFEQAGFDVAAAVEFDPVHAATHKFNFPYSTTICRTVIGLSAEEIRASSGLGDREVDVVFGGAPCQGFSLIGQRSLDDPRNKLVQEFLRIVVELGAKFFVFENVKGLTVGSQRHFLDEIVEAFKENGYNVRLPWQVLNACTYGVPQSRERLFLLGAKRGYRLPEYPSPTTGTETNLFNSIAPIPTCADALEDLPEADEFEDLLNADCVIVPSWEAASEYGREMRCKTKDAWHCGYKRRWNPDALTSSSRTDHTDTSRRRFRETPCGEVEPISRFFKLAPDGISNTLRAGTDSARGAFTSPRPIHYKSARCVTVREMARLHGYPDWFRFHQTKWHGARQVGNSVPPPLARIIAESILLALEVKPTKPRPVIDLENPKLLTLDMTEAAAHFNVPVPIGRRDKKSGAKKRKQEEIEAVGQAAREEV